MVIDMKFEDYIGKHIIISLGNGEKYAGKLTSYNFGWLHFDDTGEMLAFKASEVVMVKCLIFDINKVTLLD